MICPNPHCRAEMVPSARYLNVVSCPDCGYSVTRIPDVDPKGRGASSKPNNFKGFQGPRSSPKKPKAPAAVTPKRARELSSAFSLSTPEGA